MLDTNSRRVISLTNHDKLSCRKPAPARARQLGQDVCKVQTWEGTEATILTSGSEAGLRLVEGY